MTKFVFLPTMFALTAMLGFAFTAPGSGGVNGPGACSDEVCKADKGAKAKCKLCASDATLASTTTNKNAKEKEATLSPGGCPGGKCLGGGGAGKCALTAVASDGTVKAESKQCELCDDEECKQECAQCADTETLAVAKTDAQKASKDAPKKVAPADEPKEVARGGAGMMGRGRGAMGRGRGMGHGPGMMGQGPGAMGGMREDMTTLHAMFADKSKIKRKVTKLPDGAEAITESDDEAIADLIQEHVPAMEDRVVGNRPLPPMTFHPIFVELIKHADDYTLTYEETEKGIKVRYTAESPFVVMLVQEHAKLVSRFLKNGMQEIHKPYTLPKVKTKRKAKPAAEAPKKGPAK